MIVTGRHLPRRTFLKTMGTAIALPYLDAMTPAFASVAGGQASAGNPALAGALTWIDCDLRDVHDAGDHHIVTGQAHTLGVAQHTDEPLLYFQGSYRHLRQA